jgi:cell division protein FtsB
MSRRLRAALLAGAALLVLGYGGQAAFRVWEMRREVEAAERELAALRSEADRLATAIERLRSDPEYIERVAREALGLVKPGEQVLKLPPGPGG